MGCLRMHIKHPCLFSTKYSFHIQVVHWTRHLVLDWSLEEKEVALHSLQNSIQESSSSQLTGLSPLTRRWSTAHCSFAQAGQKTESRYYHSYPWHTLHVSDFKPQLAGQLPVLLTKPICLRFTQPHPQVKWCLCWNTWLTTHTFLHPALATTGATLIPCPYSTRIAWL